MSSTARDMSGPIWDAEAVDISVADFTPTRPARAVWIGTGGDLRVELEGGGIVTYANIPDGTLLPVRTKRVIRTGTTATNMVANW